MKQLPNFDATRNLTNLLSERLRNKTSEIFKVIAARGKTLSDAKTYIAIQDEIVVGLPDDMGVIRVVATYHHRLEYTDLYLQAQKHKQPLDNIAPVKPDTDAIVDLTITIPLFGQIVANAKVNPHSGTITQPYVSITNEGSVGTLWFNTAMDVLDKVALLNLLSAPQFEEKITDW